MPELISNGFQCNCESQNDMNLFKKELQKRQNKDALRRLVTYMNSVAVQN